MCTSNTDIKNEPDKEIECEIKSHTRNMSNHYKITYPDHDVRKNTAIYNKTHHEMRHIPCFICGGKEHLETHHFYIEKAAQNAIDWHSFGEFAKTCHNIQSGLNINHFDWNEVSKNPDLFVDSSHNMIVLCKKHHTSSGKGIHHVPYPDWILQKFAISGFEFLG